MAILQSHLKILWALSGNKCAICKNQLIEEHPLQPRVYTNLGEQAHIVADSSVGPRSIDGDPNNNHYSNFIILCPTCHTRVDDQPDYYTTDFLRNRKIEHESNVIKSKSLYKIAPYYDIIAAWEKECLINKWSTVTEEFCSDGRYFLHDMFIEGMNSFSIYFLRVIQSPLLTNSEVNLAFENFINIYTEFYNLFSKHEIHYADDIYTVNKFYRNGMQQDVDKYNQYVDLLFGLMIELTRAGNHIINMVRRHIDLSYRHAEGHLICVYGGLVQGYIHANPQYDASDIAQLPFSNIANFKKRFQ